MNKVVILIPALDPPESFPNYIKQLIDNDFPDIIVVDDGSKNNQYFLQAEAMGCIVLRHQVNIGKGQALKTGLSYYRDHFDQSQYVGIITADSDGQHLCEDIKKLALEMKNGCQKLLLGVRNFADPSVPPKSKFGNNLTTWIFHTFLRFSVSDTQTGLRGIPNALIESCINLGGKRFEYETSMLIDVGKKAGITEIPITTVYFDDNTGTHFNPIVDSVKIYGTIFGCFFRYLFSSLSASLLDILLFALFSKVLLRRLPHRILYSTGAARICSACYNFCVNRNVVFKSHAGYGKSAAGYCLLCIIQAVISALLVTFFHSVTKIDEVAVKILVDTILFFFSYQIQKRLIFK